MLYGSATELRATLDYDFSEEKRFSYRGLAMPEIIHHLAVFVSRLWQIHIFAEGNTRTTAVFFIQYLRSLGFNADNDIFAENAWYFRNALVRANYNDLKNGIHETTEYLELFLRNLLLNENHPLLNRTLHISRTFDTPERGNAEALKANIEPEEVNNKPDKANIEPERVNIKPEKVNIDPIKVNIPPHKPNFEGMFTPKTAAHIQKLFTAFGSQTVFGRSDVQTVLDLKPTRSSALISEMAKQGIIEPVYGHGKGKYRFRIQQQ